MCYIVTVLSSHGSEDGEDGAGSYPESSEGAWGWSRKYASLR